MDGVLSEEEEEVRSKVVQFYQATELDSWHPSMDCLEFTSIEEDERLVLERDFLRRRWFRSSKRWRVIKPLVLMASLWPFFKSAGV